MADMNIEERIISRSNSSLPVYIVEKHHHSLLPWFKLKNRLGKPPSLICLDHHADCRIPFHQRCAEKYGAGTEKYYEMSRQLVAKANMNVSPIKEHISMLRHDEHLSAALLFEVVSSAFVIFLDASGIDSRLISVEEEEIFEEDENNSWGPPSPLDLRDKTKGLYLIYSECYPSCSTILPHNDDCVRIHYDSVLESSHLDYHLAKIHKLARQEMLFNDLFSTCYILDIDLDFFHTTRSVSPENATMFHKLLRHAQAVTIAKESNCVNGLRLEGENISSDFLLDKMLEHANKALKTA